MSSSFLRMVLLWLVSASIFLSSMSTAVYLVFGEDEYLVTAKAKELVESLVPPDQRALGLEILDGAANTVDEAGRVLNQCIEGLQTLGFFGNQKVVWLRDASFLTDNVIGKSEGVKSRLSELTEIIKKGLAPEQALLVSSPKVDKRKAFYKACAGAGEVFEYGVSAKAYQAEQQASDRLREIVSRAGLKMSSDIATLFLERVGTDTRQMVNEVEKLSVYLGNRTTVEARDLAAVTSSSRNALAWDLADAAGRRDLKRALEILRQLLFQSKKESPIGLLMGLGSRIRELMVYRQALANGWLAEKAGYQGRTSLQWGNVPADVNRMLSEDFGRDPRKTHPFRVNLLAQQAKQFSAGELKSAQKAILGAHEQLVSSAVPAAMILEVLLIRILSRRPRRQ